MGRFYMRDGSADNTGFCFHQECPADLLHRGKLVARGFAIIADEKVATGEGGMVPGLAAEGIEFAEFLEAFGLGGTKVDGTVFALDDDKIADEQTLA
jgi:hypothetical protein